MPIAVSIGNGQIEQLSKTEWNGAVLLPYF